jgi:hypothetical protein
MGAGRSDLGGHRFRHAANPVSRHGRHQHQLVLTVPRDPVIIVASDAKDSQLNRALPPLRF